MEQDEKIEKIMNMSDERVGQCVKKCFKYLDMSPAEIDGFTGHQIAIILTTQILVMNDIIIDEEQRRNHENS